MTKRDVQDITNALLRVMCKADAEFQEQLANGIGVSLDTFQEYLDRVDFADVTILPLKKKA